ncbi:hypothetical protein A2111_01070 [Candidatus Daviesbacteria bacterium GWA1_38_6]|nr:MAG: hypothetical protein A2111_01070 [Candidatus Daviesbacteria bacterium GWA1_38_6]
MNEGENMDKETITRRGFLEKVRDTVGGLIGLAILPKTNVDNPVRQTLQTEQLTIEQQITKLEEYNEAIRNLPSEVTPASTEQAVKLAQDRRSVLFNLMETDVNAAREVLDAGSEIRTMLLNHLQESMQEEIASFVEREIHDWQGSWGEIQPATRSRVGYSFGNDEGNFALYTDQRLERIAPPQGNIGGDIVIENGYRLQRGILAGENAIKPAPQAR